MWNQLLDSENKMQMTANTSSWDVTAWTLLKTNQWTSVCSHSLKYTNELKYKNVKWPSIKFKWWRRTMCPRHLPRVRERRLSQAIEPEEKCGGYQGKWKTLRTKKSQWPERWLIVSNCKTLTCCDYFKYHWCVLAMTVKTESCTFGFTPSFEN